jgi:hypothetical protein
MDWKADIVLGEQVNEKKKAESKSETSDLSNKIKEVGDKIRNLKLEKAAKVIFLSKIF